jgi:hypothetical protein
MGKIQETRRTAEKTNEVEGQHMLDVPLAPGSPACHLFDTNGSLCREISLRLLF